MRQAIEQAKDGSSQNIADDSTKKTISDFTDGLQIMSEGLNQNGPSNDEKRVSVQERLRVPVSYDDNLLGSDHKDDAT